MAYDQARHRVVLFGGHGNPFASTGLHGDTWEWDGTSWTQLFPASGPSARAGHVMAYSPARSRVMLFGGFDCSGALADTWEWDGNNWMQQSSPVAPTARSDSAMAQDGRGNVLLFGGVWSRPGVPAQYFSDTWEWNGQWVQRTLATFPKPRGLHTMAFDARRGRVVLYGGYRGAGMRFSDTWEWDGSNWTERMPTSIPPLLANGLTMAYDGFRDRVVLYIYRLFSGSEVWEWDGGEWTKRSPATSPPPRYPTAMAYDWLRAKIVLFGGQGSGANRSDTWEYYTQSPASYATFGTGCAGSAGTPTLGLVGGLFGRPWTGSTITVALANLPPGHSTAIALGASNSRWGTLNLPFDLSALGMPGCTLYSSAEVFIPLSNPAGTANLSLSIPNNAALVGGVFYNQAIVVDPPANSFGLAWSNAGAGTVGAR